MRHEDGGGGSAGKDGLDILKQLCINFFVEGCCSDTRKSENAATLVSAVITNRIKSCRQRRAPALDFSGANRAL